MTTRSEPVMRSGNYWVFYTATVGHLRPGHYEVGFLHTWANPVNDGYNDYGPGTATTRDSGICNFDVMPNPGRREHRAHNGMYFPTIYPTHNITPAGSMTTLTEEAAALLDLSAVAGAGSAV